MKPKLMAGAALRAGLNRLVQGFPTVGRRLQRDFLAPDMRFSIQLLQRAGFAPECAIDVGAYRGEWAQALRAVYPQARVMMIDPTPELEAELTALCTRDPQLAYRRAFVSSERSYVHFREQATNSGGVPQAGADTTSMPTVPLDELLDGGAFRSPQLLKVDTQGYDLEVLKGAARTLDSVEVLITEMSLIRLSPIAPSFREFIDWLDDAGFRLLDIPSLIRRPVDDALWQIDGIFVRKDSKLGSAAAGW